MSPFAQAILALAITHAPPARSPYSFEPAAHCGSDPTRPSCELRPLCQEPSFRCRPPRWSPARSAWVKSESRETALLRYAKIARAIADSANRLVRCLDAEGNKLETCTPEPWPDSPRLLGLATLAVALHESGLREDIQFGVKPLGRGPAGEVCLVQVAPEQAPKFASWLSPDGKQRILKSKEERETFAQSMLGDSPEALSRCFEIGMRMLIRSRTACAPKTRWEHGMFAMYGSGAHCRLPGVADRREHTFRRLRSAQPKLAAEVLAFVTQGGRDAASDATLPEKAPESPTPR